MKYNYLTGKKLARARLYCDDFIPNPKLTYEKLLKKYGKFIVHDLEERLVEEMLIFTKKIDISMLSSPYFVFPYKIDLKNGQGIDTLKFLVDITDTTTILSVELKQELVDRYWSDKVVTNLKLYIFNNRRKNIKQQI